MGENNDRQENSSGRSDAIDQYRGFAILLMVLVDYLSHIQRVPAWLKHAPGYGLTVADLVAPLFIFAIGLTYRPSFQKRLLRDGRWQTVLHFIGRDLALIGIGMLTPWGYTWGLFQTIGGAGLITLPLIWLPWLMRLVAGITLLGGYQLLSDRFWWGRVTATSSWCEVEGTLGWAAMLLLASVLADWPCGQPRGRRFFLLGSATALAFGIGLSRWVVLSQYYVSASYLLISLGVSGVLFLGFQVLTDHLQVRLPLLIAWGKNPLVLYLLHYWIWVLVFVRPLRPSWYLEAPLWLMVLQAGGFVALLSLVAWYLDRQGWIASL
jgi:predicted acyltransferase